MFGHRFVRIGRLALAAAALLLASGVASAQRGGGGHGGGGHGGGGHGGGHAGGGFSHAGGGGYHGYAGGYHHGYPGGYYHHGYPGSYYHHHHDHDHFFGFYGFGLGFYPWFGDDYYGYPRRFYDYFPEYAVGSYAAYRVPGADHQAYYPQGAEEALAESSFTPDPNAVMIGVRVPPDAEIWVNGDKTQMSGRFREFMSPPLDPNKNYTYDLQAQWTQNGQVVSQERKIAVRAGQHVGVDFLAPPPGSKPAGTPGMRKIN
jgi:uncharacterized protein (TIGR03000 family)